jgi:hypothetical protein
MTFTAKFSEHSQDTCKYRVEDNDQGKLIRAFTATIPCSQRASARGWNEHFDERKVERWCELNRHQLPKDGGTIAVDLNEVSRD